jgi:tetratricopeptide (TPR) repeat protein
LHGGLSTTHEEIADGLAGAMPALREAGDEAALARAMRLSGMLLFWRGQTEAALVELERAEAFARSAGAGAEEMECRRMIVSTMFHGSSPVEAVLERIDAIEAGAGGAGSLAVNTLRFRGELVAMQGDFDTGRTLTAEAQALAQELGQHQLLGAGVPHSAAGVEMLAGNPQGAERELRAGCKALEQIGDWGHLVTLIPYLVDALLAQGRAQEAAPLVERSFEQAVGDDADAQVGLRRAQARLLAEQGRFDEAEHVAREAVARAEPTDFLDLRGRALSDLAEVLVLAGKHEEAMETFERGAQVYDRKGNLVMAARTRKRLEEAVRDGPA